MADAESRKKSALDRLRTKLKKSRESLADQFVFRMFVVIHFKDKLKKNAVFEMAEVVPIMTNNYEKAIMKGANDDTYSMESTIDLITKDVVQLHGYRWKNLRPDVTGDTELIDYFLWPRKDIQHIECKLFSHWKADEDSQWKPYPGPYCIHHHDYEDQLPGLLLSRERNGLVVSNPAQNLFLFLNRQQLKSNGTTKYLFKAGSFCVYMPQDRLTNWCCGSLDQVMNPLISTIE